MNTQDQLQRLYQRDTELQRAGAQAIAAEAERVKRETEHQRAFEEIEEERAEVRAQIRRGEFEKRKVENETLRATVHESNRAYIEQFMAVVEVALSLLPVSEAASQAWKWQQDNAINAISDQSRNQDNMAYLRAETQLPNAVHPKFALTEAIGKITDPKRKQVALFLSFGVYGYENFSPLPSYNAQAETDQMVRGDRHRYRTR